MMIFNDYMNDSHRLLESSIFYRHQITSRASMIGIALPLEVLAVIQNIFKASAELIFIAGKTIMQVVDFMDGSKSFQSIKKELPGFFTFIQTIEKICLYILGTVLTATLGVLLPRLNFQVHTTLGIVKDDKIEAILRQKELELVQQREEFQQKLQETIKKKLQDLRQARQLSDCQAP